MIEPNRTTARPPNPALVEMWRNNLRKSQVGQAPSRQRDQTLDISIVFDGGGVAPIAGMAGLLHITFPCRILGCHIFAGDMNLQPVAVTATVDLRLGQQGLWLNGSTALWLTAPPTITAAVEAEVDITDWTVDLEPGDLIPYSLLSFIGPTATWLAVSLPIRRLELTATTSADVAAFDDTITDASGNTVVMRG